MARGLRTKDRRSWPEVHINPRDNGTLKHTHPRCCLLIYSTSFAYALHSHALIWSHACTCTQMQASVHASQFWRGLLACDSKSLERGWPSAATPLHLTVSVSYHHPPPLSTVCLVVPQTLWWNSLAQLYSFLPSHFGMICQYKHNLSIQKQCPGSSCAKTWWKTYSKKKKHFLTSRSRMRTTY